MKWNWRPLLVGTGLCGIALSATAQDSTTAPSPTVPPAPDSVAPRRTTLDPVIVTVTRGVGSSPLDAPFAMSIIRPDSARPGQRHLALDELLALVPGLTAVNRTNPSQDPRISIRGFGARSAFGVRGVRVLRDGMPLTLPDGQTPVDYLSLESVDRIEVTPGTIMRWNQGSLRHALRNIGTKRFRNVIVEVKGRRTGA